MSLRPNPFYEHVRRRLDECGDAILIPWEGYVWRFNAIEYPRPQDVLSGLGALRNGSRWNARGTFPVVYGSIDQAVAIAEVTASEAYYGLTTRKPRLFVCIRLQLRHVLDLSSTSALRSLGLRLKDIQTEDWRKLHDAGRESLTQCIGRATADAGAEGILVRSARVKRGLNFAWFPRNIRPGCVASVCEPQLLKDFATRAKKA
jgi:RES domain-containing protein